MRSTVSRADSCTARRREAGSSGAGSARSTVNSAASNSSRSPTIARDSASLRLSSSARGSGLRPSGAEPPHAGGAGSRRLRTRRAPTRPGASSRRCYTGRLPALPSRCPFPSGASRRGRFRPEEGRSRETVVAYEILLMLDADLQKDARRRSSSARASSSRRRTARGCGTTSGAGAGLPTRSATRERARTTS